MKKGKFIPHKFWVDGVFYKDIETFQELARQLIKESMKSNGFTFRKKNKKEYVKTWLKYFASLQEDILNPNMAIADTIFSSRAVYHKRPVCKMNSRFSKTVKYRIMKQLEQF